MRQINVGLIGFGTVGVGVVKILQHNSGLIEKRMGAKIVLKRIADIDLKIAEEAYSLPEYSQKDPADRIIIATARIHQCPLVTADRRIIEYPHVDTVW